MLSIESRGGAVRRVQALVVGVLAVAFSVAPDAARAEGDGAEGEALSLEQALRQALRRNKDLVGVELGLAESAGRLEQAGLRPNPELAIVVEDFAGSGDFESFDGAQTTLSLEWVFEGRQRRERVKMAEAGSALAAADAEIRRLEVAADTAEHFLECLASQARLERAAEAISLGERTVSAVSRRVRAGKAPRAELARAEAELAADRLARDDVAHELSIAHHRLAAQWGETQPSFARVEGDLLALPEVASYEDLQKGLEGNPQLARYATQERLAQANLRLAEVRRWPAVRPGLGVRRLEASDDYALVAGISVPIPFLNRNQGEISGARAAIARSRAEADAGRVRLQTTLFALYEELQHYFHRAETLREEVVPRLVEALEGTRRGYERGRYGYFELRSVQAELLRAENDLLEASIGAHRLVVALERLTGERVTK